LFIFLPAKFLTLAFLIYSLLPKNIFISLSLPLQFLLVDVLLQGLVYARRGRVGI